MQMAGSIAQFRELQATWRKRVGCESCHNAFIAFSSAFVQGQWNLSRSGAAVLVTFTTQSGRHVSLCLPSVFGEVYLSLAFHPDDMLSKKVVMAVSYVKLR